MRGAWGAVGAAECETGTAVRCAAAVGFSGASGDHSGGYEDCAEGYRRTDCLVFPRSELGDLLHGRRRRDQQYGFGEGARAEFYAGEAAEGWACGVEGERVSGGGLFGTVSSGHGELVSGEMSFEL